MAAGRPRSFDVDAALDRALEVFWRQGYEGTSISDLTTAMGINPPSLYSAFGNKEALFRKALDRYSEGPGSHVGEALKALTARAVAEQLLRETAERAAAPGHPGGCLMVRAALACGDAADPMREELTSRRSKGEVAIRQRLERAKAEGDLPADANPADLARYLTTVIYGISVQAAGGATRSQLRRVAELALRCWPEGKPDGKTGDE